MAEEKSSEDGISGLGVIGVAAKKVVTTTALIGEEKDDQPTSLEGVMVVFEDPTQMDRGDAPAQAVIDKNLKAQAERRAEETKYELQKIHNRVDQTMAAFELSEQVMNDNKEAYFVPDLIELEKVIGDAIKKRKYQQQVMIFVVGFEEATGTRLKLLNQINDFFTVYINNIDEKELIPKAAEVDFEQISNSVQEALATANSATQRLSDINHEMVLYVEKLQNGKALTKSKKKLEKALVQAKDDIMNLTERLMGAQTEIEEKEDQMTKLYKQIDFRNIEVMKYKNVAENAKKKLEQVEDLKLEVQERDEEIERLNKAAFEQQLSMKQMEQSKESSFSRLKAAHDENQQSIEKLTNKVQSLQLLLEDAKSDLQKQHKLEIEELRKQHQDDLARVQVDLQQKVDQLEEDALNQNKGWASDSEDDREIYSRSSAAGTLSRRSLPTRDGVGSLPSSRQGSKKTPIPPDTPKSRVELSEPTTPKTPKRPIRNKSSLEPVHEVPFEEKIELEDEDKWIKVPHEKLPSAFKQYRKEALLVVHGLQDQIKASQTDHAQKVKQLRDHIKEKEEIWEGERIVLAKQVETVKQLKDAAEKEADDALQHLETFVKEQGQVVEVEEKKLKRLTPEQRAKFVDKKDSKKKKEGEGKKAKKSKQSSKKNSSEALKKDTPSKATPRIESVPESAETESVKNLPDPPEVETAMQNIIDEEDDDKQDVLSEQKGEDIQDAGETEVDTENQRLAVAYESILKGDDEEKLETERIDRGQQTSRQEYSARMTDPPVVKKPLFSSGRGNRGANISKVPKKKPSPSLNSAVKIPVKKDKTLELLTVSYADKGTMVDDLFGSSISMYNSQVHIHGGVEGSFVGSDDTDRIEEEAMARHLERILERTQWSDGDDEDDGDEEEEDGKDGRFSSVSQRSLYEKFKAQLEQKKLEITERRSRATSMHGSLLNFKGEESDRTSVTTYLEHADDDYDAAPEKQEIGTSPFTFSALSKASRNSSKSILSLTEQPIIQDFLQSYDFVKELKETLSQAFSDKDLTMAGDHLGGLRPVIFDKEQDVPEQISNMTKSIGYFLREISTVVTDYLNQTPEPTVSSMVTSRLNTGKSLGLQCVAPPEAPLPPAELIEKTADVLQREMSNITVQSDPVVKELQENYKKLKEEMSFQKKHFEDKLNNNAMSMMVMEETINELQQELAGLGTSPSKLISAMSKTPSQHEVEVDNTIIFSRMDTERNQKALKRGINSHKVTADQYNAAVKSMEQYNIVPAKRLAHMVRKYNHHTHMKAIEENVKRSNSIDDEVFALLEKMEALQNMRAQRWGEQMDALASERLRLASMLMETLTKIEEESGVFLIKPILSWKGRGFLPHFQSKLSTYQPPPKIFLRPITPRDGSPVHIVPAPTPLNTQGKFASRPNTRLSNRGETPPTPTGPSQQSHIPPSNDDIPIKGSSVTMVGTVPQPMWSLSNSIPLSEEKNANPMITTPRILELEINRMMIGQNTISVATKALLSDDRLVNAANGSVRSYMTISRPSANTISRLQTARPQSTGSTESERARTPPGTPGAKSKSPGLHGRTKSESALNLIQPLPPIKVPLSDERSRSPDSRRGQTEPSTHMTADLSRPVTHPSPPQTPPGSSMRQSPPLMPGADEFGVKDDRDRDVPSPGHITKVSMKSSNAVAESNFTSNESS